MNPDETLIVKSTINAPVAKVWELYTLPEHIMKWNNASPDWHTPSAINDLQVGGKFNSRMESKDGTQGFDFGGTYDEVEHNKVIAYTMGDGRKARITFTENSGQTEVEVAFEMEHENSRELQVGGWQSILDNFKQYVEKSN